MTFTNPSGAVINARLEGGYQNIQRNNISNVGSYSFTLTNEEINMLRATIPYTSSMTLKYVIATVVGGVETYWNWLDRTFTVINANPTFTTYTVADTNPITTALTGAADSKFISGYSTLQATVTSANKAVGIKGAIVSTYKLNVGGSLVATEPWSSSATVLLGGGVTTSATTTITATDSRGNTKEVNLNKTLIEYTIPTETTTIVDRQTALSEEVDISITGAFWNASFGVVTNTLTATYEYKKVGGTTWTSGATTLTPVKSGNTFSITATIKGDTATGFEIANQYDVRVIIVDKLHSLIITKTIPTSKPWIVLDDDGVGIRTVYDSTIGGALQVGGDTYIDGDTELGGALQVNGSLQIPSTADVSLSSTDNPIQIGPTTGVNLVMDNNEIMARNNGAVNNLNLNAEGGDVVVGGTNGANLQVKGVVESTYASGAGGGILTLNKPASGTSMTGKAKIDIADNRMRFFQNAGSYWGAYLPLASGGSVDSTKIITSKSISPIQLLAAPLQSSATMGAEVTATLADSYINYDIIAFHVSNGPGSVEGRWEVIFPKMVPVARTQFIIDMYNTNYKAAGRVNFSGNTVYLGLQYQVGWANNSIYLNRVIGIKLT